MRKTRTENTFKGQNDLKTICQWENEGDGTQLVFFVPLKKKIWLVTWYAESQMQLLTFYSFPV